MACEILSDFVQNTLSGESTPPWLRNVFAFPWWLNSILIYPCCHYYRLFLIEVPLMDTVSLWGLHSCPTLFPSAFGRPPEQKRSTRLKDGLPSPRRFDAPGAPTTPTPFVSSRFWKNPTSGRTQKLCDDLLDDLLGKP